MRVAVVGAGIVGLTVAHELTVRGAAVRVWDPQPVSGATWAAAGMLAPTGEFDPWEETLREFAREAAGLFPAMIERLGVEPSAVDYSAAATITVGTDASDSAALRHLTSRASAAGGHFEPLTTSSLRRLEPGLAPVAAAWVAPGDHAVDPRALTAAIMRDLDRRAGGHAGWLTPTAVVHIDAPARDSPDRSPQVTDSAGERTTVDAIIVASGHSTRTDGLPAWVQRSVRPVYGDILRLRVGRWTAPLEHTVRALVRGRAVYLVPRAAGGLVVGATEREDGADQPLAGPIGDLLRDARAVYPAVAECEVVEVTAQARPATRDNAPLLGPAVDDHGVPIPQLHLALGAYRHGVLLSPWIARTVADTVLEGAEVPRPVAATRSPREEMAA
ncbi:FAD-dependent oxidoreductase [Microbacterium sp. C23T]